MAIKNFNRIINLYFLTEDGKVINSIKTPIHGRKPSIQINGSYSTSSYLPAFNINVKNLYLDVTGNQQYSKIRVEAGYADNYETIEGTILSLYQESPGPEGNTIIQCQQGNLNLWLSSTVNVSYEKGEKLSEIIDKLSKDLGLKGVEMGYVSKSLVLRENLVLNGKVTDLIDKLTIQFSDVGLVIKERDNKLCAVAVALKDYVGTKRLNYMSAPAQQNTGDENGAFYTTVNAPWIPGLRIGDALIIPMRQYIRNFQAVGAEAKEQTISVTSLQFQFSTTSNANSMTVQGYRL